jgi:wobble nucleotide-excising tRNase
LLFSCFKAGAGEKIFSYLERYANFDFKIDYEQWLISFSRGEEENIKISRGEENIFIWCIFLAICTLVIEGHESYAWVKYIYIDDPISSLDDNNAIAVATDLINTLKKPENTIKCIISSHHGLFFNVLWNEFRRSRTKYNTYFFYRTAQGEKYLAKNDELPSFIIGHAQRVAACCKCNTSTRIIQCLRSIMEKTAVFFGTKIFHRAFMELMTKCCLPRPQFLDMQILLIYPSE